MKELIPISVTTQHFGGLGPSNTVHLFSTFSINMKYKLIQVQARKRNKVISIFSYCLDNEKSNDFSHT
jgi:DNA gyrase/topoisomerase IV subunit B